MTRQPKQRMILATTGQHTFRWLKADTRGTRLLHPHAQQCRSHSSRTHAQAAAKTRARPGAREAAGLLHDDSGGPPHVHGQHPQKLPAAHPPQQRPAAVPGHCVQLAALVRLLRPLSRPHLHELVAPVLLLLLLLAHTGHGACLPGQGQGAMNLFWAPAVLLEPQPLLQAASAARC